MKQGSEQNTNMRIYLNCVEAITDIGRELKKCATTVHTQTMQNKPIADNSDYVTKEIQAFSFTILDTVDKDLMPKVHLEYCKQELADRVSGESLNPGNSYKIREEVWNEFLIEGGTFDYTYSERMHWQLAAIITELNTNPETRQAIIEVHDRTIDQNRMGFKRIPCSMFYQFMLRDGKLDIIYVMRSTDFVTHFQNDIWLAIGLQEWIAKHVEVPTGKFIMFASSLHAYKKDWEELKNY